MAVLVECFSGYIGTVVAACRDPSSAVNLHALKRMAGNETRLDLVKMDIEDQASLESAAEYTKSKYGVSGHSCCAKK